MWFIQLLGTNLTMEKETKEMVQELLKTYLDDNKINRLNILLNKLKKHRDTLNEQNISSFESVIANLADILPEEYSYKLKSLNYYNDFDDNFELPY